MAMDWDEARAKAAPSAIMIGQDLAVQSIGELKQRILELQAEIARTEQELQRKQAHEAAASALFKS